MPVDDYEILKRPIRTEKAERQRSYNNQYTFEVALEANKVQIKRAVEEVFGVDVVSVNTMIMPGKGRGYGGRISPVWKKAVVTIAPGQRIDFFEGV